MQQRLADIDRDEVVAHFTSNPGVEYSPEMMMRELGLSKQSVYIIMKPLVDEGRVLMRQSGLRRYWYAPAPAENFAVPMQGANLNFRPLGDAYLKTLRAAHQLIRERELVAA